MAADDLPYVFAVTEVLGAERIDGGRTLALRFRRPDEGENILLLSKPLGEDLSRVLAEILGKARDEP